MGIPVFCSYIRRKDMDAVLNCLVTDSVGPGEYLERFQKACRENFGFDYGFAVRSPHIALGIALDALGIEKGSTVALPALSPAYYGRVLTEKGLEPLYFDVGQDSAELSAESLGSAIAVAANKPRAILLFEPIGILPDPDGFKAFGLPIIEDISQSLGAVRGEVKAGSIGQLTILGLEGGGLMTSGGGALLYASVRRDGTVLRNIYDSIEPELRMTDYNAALGLAQLKELAGNVEKRRELYQLFGQSVARTRHRLLSQGGEGEPGYWAFPVAFESGMKDACAYAKKKEIDTAPAFDNSLLGLGSVPEGLCPNSRSILLRSLLFPVHQRVGGQGSQKIARVLATLP